MNTIDHFNTKLLITDFDISPNSFKKSDDLKPNLEVVNRIIQCIDLTTLEGNSSVDDIKQLCELGKDLGVASICLYPIYIQDALKHLEKSSIKICTVSAGFPHGLNSLESKIFDVIQCADLGAQEIDIVIRRDLALSLKWRELFDEISQLKKGAKKAKLKVILETGELKEPVIIYNASLIAMMAGADFIKTSTGKAKINATLEAGYVMMNAIKDYHQATGSFIGIKAAGGISTLQTALQWWNLTGSILDDRWQSKDLFRIGASSLIQDIQHHLKGLSS